jgi:hypothetical protein
LWDDDIRYKPTVVENDEVSSDEDDDKALLLVLRFEM